MRPLDPKIKRKRRSLYVPVFFCLFAITIVLYALGQLPQIDVYFASINEALQSHNADVAQIVTKFLPLGLAVFGVFLLMVFISYTRNKGETKFTHNEDN